MIRGIDRAVRGDGGGGRAGSAAGYLPIPGTVLSVEECLSYLKGSSAWSDARTWVSTDAGARNAVLFTRAAQIAYRSHPIEEKARKLRRVRCPDCGQLSFVRNPPAAADMPVIVRCENEKCGKTIREGDTTAVYGHDPEDDAERTREKLVVIAEIERTRA
jgi:ribosomal protein S27E